MEKKDISLKFSSGMKRRCQMKDSTYDSETNEVTSRRHKKKRRKHKSKSKLKKKRESNFSDTSDSDSDTSSTSSEKRKKRKKHKKEKRKKHKSESSRKNATESDCDEVQIGPLPLSKVKNNQSSDSPSRNDCHHSTSGPLPTSSAEGVIKSMAPMTKDEWEKRQSVVRKVFDEDTGRWRLVKGDGEILEEIVSRDRHREINRLATAGDAFYFQNKIIDKIKRS